MLDLVGAEPTGRSPVGDALVRMPLDREPERLDLVEVSPDRDEIIPQLAKRDERPLRVSEPVDEGNIQERHRRGPWGTKLIRCILEIQNLKFEI
jgi:hypothetical protein